MFLTAHIHSLYGRFIEKDKYYGLYIVIKYKGGVYKSLGKASVITKTDVEKYIDNIKKFLDFKDNQYFIDRVEKFHFCFKNS